MVNGRVPVLMNIAEQSTRGAIEAAQKAEDDGARGLMMLPPMRYKAGDRETVEYFKAVANNTSLPIMIYNNPVDYKIEVTLDMFEELLKIRDEVYPVSLAIWEMVRLSTSGIPENMTVQWVSNWQDKFKEVLAEVPDYYKKNPRPEYEE